MTFALPGLEGPASTKSQALSASAGLILTLGGGWAVTPEMSWQRERTVTRRVLLLNDTTFGAAVRSGAISLFRDLNASAIDFTPYLIADPETVSGPYEAIQRLYSLRASGPLFALPGGDLQVTGLVERREEVARASLSSNAGATARTYSYQPRRSQDVNSGYVEVRAPIVGARNNVPFVYALELQASVRHDQYTTRAPTPTSASLASPTAQLPTFIYTETETRSTDFTIAGRWLPTPDFALRASYATGFLPPAINQIVERRRAGTSTLAPIDPLRGNTRVGSNGVAWTDVSVGNPNLVPEQSKSWSAGVILTPRFLPGFRLSADYTSIRKTNEIGLPDINVALANPDLYPGLVIRGPNLATDPPGWAGPVIELHRNLVNIARSRVRAFDFQADYEFDAGSAGRFHLYGVATRQAQLVRQFVPTGPVRNLVDFSDGPLLWRGNIGIDWELGGWRLAWNGQYYHSYSVRFGTDPTSSLSNASAVAQGAERIPSQFYQDIGLSYDFGAHKGALSNLRLAVGIQNVFDHRPPPVALLTNGYSYYGDPRLRRFTLSLRKELNF